uniref:Uncharacterized protein n=1 Tax=Cajanus cajan TaxID=3821 RepID=A0A151TFG2_CAJCA|nr:hypothetical protein KK1_012058 [Cajanus cajan]
MERLDRALVNMKWCLIFLEDEILHLHSIKYDHIHLLLYFSLDNFFFKEEKAF